MEFDSENIISDNEAENKAVENRARFLARLEGLPEETIQLIEFAYDLAKEAHRPQKREGGDRYFEHPREVALILIDECGIKDPELIIAALLHDTAEDTPIFCNSTLPYSDWKKTALFRLGRTFSPEVAEMVITLTKPKADGKEIETEEKAHDIYLNNLSEAPAKTILAKMADRLHNLRTLGDTPPEKQHRKIDETRRTYFPIFQKVLQDYPKEGRLLLDEMEKAIAALEK